MAVTDDALGRGRKAEGIFGPARAKIVCFELDTHYEPETPFSRLPDCFSPSSEYFGRPKHRGFRSRPPPLLVPRRRATTGRLTFLPTPS